MAMKVCLLLYNVLEFTNTEHNLFYPKIGQNEIVCDSSRKMQEKYSAAMVDGIAKPITFQ